MLNLLDKYYKPVLINMFKEVKEAMSKELKYEIMFHQIENIGKKKEIIDENQRENSGLGKYK